MLALEWTRAKASEILLYRDLAKFFSDNFPDVKVAEDVVRERAVSALTHGGTFASTHDAVTALERIGTFTVPQVNRLLRAAIDNSQVRWIMGDDDLAAFYQRLLTAYGSKADPELVATVRAVVEDLPPGIYLAGPDGYGYWDGEAWQTI